MNIFNIEVESGPTIEVWREHNDEVSLKLPGGPSLGPVPMSSLLRAALALTTFADEDQSVDNFEFLTAGSDRGAVVEWALSAMNEIRPGVADEFLVDGDLWQSDETGRCRPHDNLWQWSLADEHWDIGTEGLSPGNAQYGWYCLICVGKTYSVYHMSGCETSDEGDLAAVDDESAIAEFRERWGEAADGVTSD